MEGELSLGSWRFAAYEIGLGERQGAHQADYDVGGWLDARSPGEIIPDLIRAGLLPDPENSRWVEEKEWWYRTEFTLPFRDPRKPIFLLFDAPNMKATIWLNGQVVNNLRDLPDVTNLLKPGPNIITIRLTSVSRSRNSVCLRLTTKAEVQSTAV